MDLEERVATASSLFQSALLIDNFLLGWLPPLTAYQVPPNLFSKIIQYFFPPNLHKLGELLKISLI
jgi:hypothetical protein